MVSAKFARYQIATPALNSVNKSVCLINPSTMKDTWLLSTLLRVVGVSHINHRTALCAVSRFQRDIIQLNRMEANNADKALL